MKKSIIALFLLAIATIGFTQNKKLKKQQIAELIEMKIPENFMEMNNSERLKTFVTANQPLGVFTSMDRQAYLNINRNKLKWAPNDLKMLQDFYKASIRSMFEKVTFIQEGIQEINGKKYVVFEFVSSLKEDDNAFSAKKAFKNYNYILYTLYKGSTLVFNFGCRDKFKPLWQATAKEMMNSVKIK